MSTRDDHGEGAALDRPPRTLAELLAALPEGLAAGARTHALRDEPGRVVLGPLRDDSRAVAAGDAFVAVPGATHDGHAFLAQVAAAGAGLGIVEAGRFAEAARREPTLAALPRLELDDVAAALPELAATWHGRPGEHMRLAGVTGTNGKTTVAHLLAAILRAAGRPHLRLGTTGNWLVDHEDRAGFTTPFPVELQALLARARAAGASEGVMEVSSHALAQGRVRPLRYRAVGLTSFSQDHLDYHPSMAAYLAAKCLLASEHADPQGVAVAPSSQGEATRAFLAAAAEAGVARRWTCAREDDGASELRVLARREPGPKAGLAARVLTPAGELELRSPLVGAFNLDNLLVSLGLALGLDIELELAGAALAEATGAPGRLERVLAGDGRPGPAVYVDYAHTPDAVARSLEALRPVTRGALIVVLGCGGDRDPSKRPLMGRSASEGADRFIATSDNPRSEDPEAIVDQMVAGADPSGATLVRELDRAAAIALAIAEAGPDDVVLIAGKGHEDYQILGDTKIHFDDREHAKAALLG